MSTTKNVSISLTDEELILLSELMANLEIKNRSKFFGMMIQIGGQVYLDRNPEMKGFSEQAKRFAHAYKRRLNESVRYLETKFNEEI